MDKINKEEYKLLKGLDDKWKWIARDSKGDHGGNLFAYLEKPFKSYDMGEWDYGEGIHPINIHRFRFIQWEDSEPYNIPELIKGYEEESKVQGTDILFNSLDKPQSPPIPGAKSEETEVKKNKKWIVDKWTKERNETDVHDPMYQFISEFIADINQLDETEDLTTEWIKDNQLMWASIHGAEYYIPANKLYGKIMPKQELPAIPKFVADYLDFAKSDVPLMRVMELANTRNEWSKWEKEYDWISANDETFARAWLYGYKVEERELTVKEVIEKHIELLKKQEVAVNLKPYYDLWEELKDE